MPKITVTVTDDYYVIVEIDGVEVDRPGPWSTLEGAEEWADSMRSDLESGVIHYEAQK